MQKEHTKMSWFENLGKGVYQAWAFCMYLKSKPDSNEFCSYWRK